MKAHITSVGMTPSDTHFLHRTGEGQHKTEPGGRIPFYASHCEVQGMFQLIKLCDYACLGARDCLGVCLFCKLGCIPLGIYHHSLSKANMKKRGLIINTTDNLFFINH